MSELFVNLFIATQSSKKQSLLSLFALSFTALENAFHAVFNAQGFDLACFLNTCALIMCTVFCYDIFMVCSETQSKKTTKAQNLMPLLLISN